MGSTSWSRVWLSLLIIVLALSVAGCAGADQSPIVGKWARRGDVYRDGSTVKATLTVDFRPDGTFVLRTQARALDSVESTTGTWVVDPDGETYHIATDGSGLSTKARIIEGELVAHPDARDSVVWKRRLW